MAGKERTHYEDALRGHLHGTAEEVVEELAEIVALSGADEVLVTTSSLRPCRPDRFLPQAGRRPGPVWRKGTAFESGT